jgi:hypothetical protein
MHHWKTAPAVALLITLASVADAETREFDLSGFDTVSVSEGIGAIVTEGAAFAIEAESRNSDHLDRLEVEVRNDQLTLGMEDRRFRWFESGGSSVTVRISMPVLAGAEVSSGASLSADRISGDALELAASSGATMEIATLEGGDVTASATSGAEIEIGSGVCDALDADTSSGAVLKMSDVVCADVVVSASSGARAEVQATTGLDASASSGGFLRIHGTPTAVRDVDVSSGGDIDLR